MVSMLLKNNDQMNIEILDTIYRSIFKRLQQRMIDVFLCGGASTKEQLSMRDKLKEQLELTKVIRILYPEELFMDILNLNKKQNLLMLEQLLADNCDNICIVCESVGSFVELGAFTNNSSTFNKVIALVQTKYKNQQSFLMLGPIRHIQASNKENVIFYNNDTDDAAKALIYRLKQTKQVSTKDIDTIVGLHYFILLALYFFKEVETGKMVDYIEQILVKNGFLIDNQRLTLLFRPAIKLLYRERLVERYTYNEKKRYKITAKGLVMAEQMLSTVNMFDKIKKCDKIRMQILYSVYY
jgi:hypothetical protein